MHYFKFHIAQVVVALQGLLPNEQAAYLRVVMQYINDESPLPHDFKKLARGWGIPFEDVETVCNDPDLCVNTDEGFVPILGNEFLETSLKEMKGKSKGGKNAAIVRAKNRILAEQQPVTEFALSTSSAHAQHEVSTSSAHARLVPITNNQEQKTKDPAPRTNLSTTVDSKEPTRGKKIPIAKPDDVSEQVWGEWVSYRKSLKAPVSETVLKGLRREGDKAGIGLELVLETCLTNGWRGFQAEWYLKNKPKEPLGSNGLPLSHASNINEKHREEKTGDFTQDDWDKLMKTGKYKQ